MPFLYTFVILLLAAVLAVPIAKRLGFGSVLGYLVAGLIIGPAGLRLVSDVESIAQVSELGVIMLLFLIGLELRPARLWVMRRAVLGLGTAQLLITAAALAAIIGAMGTAPATAVLIGFALALSSTAIVLPMLAERHLLTTRAGRDAFAVLLLQDLAVIPFVALLPLFDGGLRSADSTEMMLAVGKGAAAIAVVLVGGRYLIRPIFHAVESAKAPEIFTATALVIVIGTGLFVDLAGLSMSLGAFMAGVLLSDSEYRHEIQADIEPFEGLLLGIFFISVGMSANLGLLLQRPGFVLGAAVVLIALKAAIALALGWLSHQASSDRVRFATVLSQAGEFGFVLFGAGASEGILTRADAELLTLVVTLSMIASPLVFWLEERFVAPRLCSLPVRPYDRIEPGEPQVIICGFGRVGQIVGRILLLRHIPFTALDKQADQIDLIRRFGGQAYYGDATRPDVLRAAGIEQAKLVVVALDDVGESLKLVEHVQRRYPGVGIVARARNRRHVHLLMDHGIQNAVRETLHSSLVLTELVLEKLGVPPAEAERVITIFREHDARMLVTQHGVFEDEQQMIQTTKEAAVELLGLLEADRSDR